MRIALLFCLGFAFPAWAGQAETFLLQLLSGEAQTDAPWLAYEIEAKERDIRLLNKVLEMNRMTGPAMEVRWNEIALEQSKYRKQILEAKQLGNASKLQLIVALTDANKAGKPLDATPLVEPTKVFLQSRVAEADARLGAAKAWQNLSDLNRQKMEFLSKQGAASEKDVAAAVDKLNTVNALAEQAAAQAKLAHDLYKQLIPEELPTPKKE